MDNIEYEDPEKVIAILKGEETTCRVRRATWPHSCDDYRA